MQFVWLTFAANVLIICTNFHRPAFCNPDAGHFRQDLTDTIDKIIHGGDSDATKFLLESLNLSASVYYSSDMPMNNITDMIHVINLLNDSKPEGKPLSIMLSLRYTHQNRFSRPSFDDVYYNLSLNIPKDFWRKFKKAVTHIVLDWNTDGCEDEDYFYSKPGHWSTQQMANYSFPKYIKEFIHFYSDFSVPVGIAYNSSQIYCANYLKDQIKDADFYVLTVTFPSSKCFPFTSHSFNDYLAQIDANNSKSFPEVSHKNPFYFNVNLEEKWGPSKFTSEWGISKKNLMSSSAYYDEVLNNFIDTIHWKSLDVLWKLLGAYDSHMDPVHEIRDGLIFCQSISRYLPQLQFSRDKHKMEPGFVIPSIHANVLTSPCDLGRGLMQTGNGSLVVDKETWRALTRYETDLMEKMLYCSERGSVGYYHKFEKLIKNKVILIFDKEIHRIWNMIENNMDSLIGDNRQVGNATLSAIVFHEGDINPGQNQSIKSTGYEASEDQIVNFIRKWDGNFSAGCVINFTEERIHKLLTLKGTDFRESVKQFCNPVFGILEIIILEIDNVHGNIDGYSGKYDDVVVARTIFLKEFPEKKVLIRYLHLGNGLNSDIESWTNYYGAPVIGEKEHSPVLGVMAHSPFIDKV